MTWSVNQNGSKDGHYYIAEDTNEQNLSYSELYHYGVKGMKWGVRKNRKIRKLHRFTSSKKGIYEDARKKMTKEEWRKFLNSDAAKWLPKPPPGTYDSSKYSEYESYFTQKGYEVFIKKTLPILSKYVSNISEEETSSRIDGDIVYKDEYQIVYGKDLKHSNSKIFF